MLEDTKDTTPSQQSPSGAEPKPAVGEPAHAAEGNAVVNN